MRNSPEENKAMIRRWSEIYVYKLDNGKIEELWSEVDFLSIMMQIGAIPAQ